MTAELPHDPRWPRAGHWLRSGADDQPRLGVLGVPAHKTSLSPTNAHLTPGAVRQALDRYSTWSQTLQVDLQDLTVVDLGDVPDPDGEAGERRTQEILQKWRGELMLALGGDNSITYAVARGLGADGLITLDAHHDLRDGESNGSPVQRLVADGFDGSRIVQIGIGDFANSGEYARRARDYGITVITRDEVEERGMDDVMDQALQIAGNGPVGRIHVDLDIDVCDRAVAPGCPASVPGGISALQLRQAARAAGRSPKVVGVDFTEVDAAADTPDQRTVRLVALCALDAAAGLLSRP